MRILDAIFKMFGPKEVPLVPSLPPAPAAPSAVQNAIPFKQASIFPLCRDRLGASNVVFGIRSPIDRDIAIKEAILNGNVPSFMQNWASVTSSAMINGSVKKASFKVLPDYLLFGTNSDYLSANMAFRNAHEIAVKMDASLPTRKMVQLIYAQSKTKLTPHPMPPTSEMQSTDYIIRQNALVEQEKLAKGAVNGTLLAGHKKDVVISPECDRNPMKEAIYGWQMADGVPIQPLSFAHDMDYSDYSHGARLVSNEVVVDGKIMHLSLVLSDPSLCILLSDEGPFN